MPNGQQYDYRSDPEFLKAQPNEMAAYLKQVDPDFAKASPQDQGAYIAHLKGSGTQQQATEKPSLYERLTSPIDPGLDEFSAKHPILGAGARFLSSVGAGVLGAPQALYETARDAGRALQGKPSEGAMSMASAIQDWMDPKTRPSLRGAASVAPEALGMATGNVAAGEAVGEAAPKIRDTTALLGRSETGRLRPSVSALSRGVGAVAGRATGIPGGEIAGFISGPSLADALIPTREPVTAKAVPIKQSPYFDPAAYKAGRTAGTASANAPRSGEMPQTGSYIGRNDIVSSAFKTEETAVPSKIIRPDSPGANPEPIQGSYWSFDKQALTNAVMLGDRDAAVVYRQRFGELPPNARYLTDVGEAPMRGLYRGKQ
jgi:hypothetical protein